MVYWCYPCTICQEAQVSPSIVFYYIAIDFICLFCFLQEVKGLTGQAIARE